MPYEFRILGPVGLGRDGEKLQLGPPKRKAMVAALLLEANRPVPLPQLAGAVWAGPAPRAAVANLRSHVWELRRLLDGRLLARPRAYELRVADSELDADLFHRLARTGRRALAAREPTTALRQLERALALWHGTAGDGLPRGTTLDARLATLDELRLDVFEDHAHARLHTCEFSEIVAELRRHLFAWPVRERSWELLMLALYRSGNPPAALAAFAQARATLSLELGIEPGPRLQKLHRAVLHHDVSLDGPPAPRGSVTATPPAAQPDPVPRQLPPEEIQLVGRGPERAALTAALRAGPAVMVCGQGGVGKSALALSAAHTVATEFPDGQVVVDLGGGGPSPRPPGEVLATVGPTLDGGRRVLILLDGAADARQVRPLLTGCGDATVLVTSRRRLALPGTPQVEVGPLADRDSLDVLTGYASAARAGNEPAAMRELVRVCNGLPLALRIAGEWLARRPELPAGLLAEHLARRPLDGLRIGDLSVRDMLAGDLRAVAGEDPLAARVFPLLARAAVASPEELAGELDEDPSRVFFALERLVDRWLAESPEPGRYEAVGLARVYGAELPAPVDTFATWRAGGCRSG